MPDQAVALIGKEINMQQAGLFFVPMHRHAVHRHFVMIDPTVLRIEEKAEIGALIRGALC